MNKNRLALSLVLLLGLSACAPATTMPLPGTGTPTAPEETSVPQQANSDATPFLAGTGEAAAYPAATCKSFDTRIASSDWVQGNPDAPITMIEYSDFQCPYCANLDPVLKQLVAEYPQDVRWVFRYFPLPGHSYSLMTARAAEAAGRQGKFWEYQEALFAHQSDWAALDSEGVDSYIQSLAVDLDLDPDQFAQDRNSEEITSVVQTAQNKAYSENISYTPFLLINGMQVQVSDLGSLEVMVDSLKANNFSPNGCPPTVLQSGKAYQATIQTAHGNIQIELYPDQAPLSVNSFVYLSQQNWFKNQSFFHLIRDDSTNTLNFAILGNEANLGWYELTPELSDLKFDRPGVVGLLNSGQVFISLNASPALNGSYTIIGQVTDGLDVVQSMSAPGEVIENITITEQE